MFHERWVALLLFIGVLGMLWRMPALIALSVFPLVAFILSRALSQFTLRGVSYRRKLSQTRAFVGEQIDVTGRIENRSRLPVLSLFLRDDSPSGFIEIDPHTREVIEMDATGKVSLSQISSLKPKSMASRTFHLCATQRGYFRFSPLLLRGVDLLGMTESERTEDRPDSILVYPRMFTLDELNLAAKQPLGGLASLRRLIEDPSRNMGARDYLPSDSFRQIHWKATAHRGILQTRVNEHTSEPTVVLMLCVSTFEDVWFGSDVERFEWAVSVAASLATWAHESKCAIGLTTNGATPGFPEMIRVSARHSPDQLARVLETLSMLGAYTMARFEEFLLREQHRIPPNAAQIIVTPMMNEKIESSLLYLCERGKRIAIVCVDHAVKFTRALPCPVYHLPPSAEFVSWTQRYVSPQSRKLKVES